MQHIEAGTSVFDFEQAAPRLIRVAIIGLGTELVLDGGDISSIKQLQRETPEYDSFCKSQSIPPHMQESFRRSMSALSSLASVGRSSGSCPGPDAITVSAPRTMKRSNVISWDDYFMAVAFLSSQRSKDPSTQVGACIVNPDKRIVGIGYNGRAAFPYIATYLADTCLDVTRRFSSWLQR